MAAMLGEANANALLFHHRLNRTGQLDDFPIDSFPDWVQAFIEAAHRTHLIPRAYLGASVLAVAGGLIGNSVELRLKRTWTSSATLWVVLIGEPGSAKSWAIELASRPLEDHQTELFQDYRRQKATWDSGMLSGQGAGDRPELEHLFASDATIEALGVMLAASPGILNNMDELATWLRSMTRYQRTGGSERPQWLSLWSNRPIKVDRKTSEPIYVRRPAVSVLGGLQPGILSQLKSDSGDDGFIDRLLPTWPGPIPQVWTTEEIDPAIEGIYASRLMALRQLRRPDGEPLAVRLDREAESLWRDWFDRNGAGIGGGFAAKLPSHVSRIALGLHCLGDPMNADQPLTEATLNSAIELGEYFRRQHKRMSDHLGIEEVSVATKTSDRLLHRVRSKLEAAAPGGLTETELHRALGNSVKGPDLKCALAIIGDHGQAIAETQQTGGRPRVTWRWVGDQSSGHMKNEEITPAHSLGQSHQPEALFSSASLDSDQPGSESVIDDEPGGWHVL